MGAGTPQHPHRKTRLLAQPFAIVAAIVNAFVHSRDAYGVVPEAVWLSAVTVALIAVGLVITALQPASVSEDRP